MKFLNAVLVVESDLTPQEWLPKVKKIEGLLCRERSEDRNAPRTIDIDILFSGNEIVDTDLLTVPHPRWAERRFVLEPLAEIRSDFVVPGSSGPVRKLLDTMPRQDDVRLFSERW
jgi:2-amino-4-hydroxy-6-hydroxymethyldihydropteridine diphosphokinase